MATIKKLPKNVTVTIDIDFTDAYFAVDNRFDGDDELTSEIFKASECIEQVFIDHRCFVKARIYGHSWNAIANRTEKLARHIEKCVAKYAAGDDKLTAPATATLI